MNKEDTEHYALGFMHAMQGIEPYKFQDPYLQGLYDAGWNDYRNGRQLIRKKLEARR